MRRLAILAAILIAGCSAASSPSQAAVPTPAPSPSLAPSPSPAPMRGTLSAADAILAEWEAYPDDYCGRYLNSGFNPDLPGGVFVSMWRANLVAHEARIRAASDGTDTLAFVGCTFSYAELSQLEDELAGTEAQAWLATIPAAETSSAIDEVANQVELSISSAVPDAVDRAAAHFANLHGLPAGILHVWSDGNGAALRPWGTVRITVVGPDGRPVHVANDLMVEWASRDLPNLRCGVGDVGYGVSSDGSPTPVPCQAGTWRIWIDTGADTKALGSATVTVRGGKTTLVTIKVSSVPAPQA